MAALLDLGQLVRVANFFGLPASNRGAQPIKDPKPVRIGVLGASQVATYALVWPARNVSSAEVVAVAARDAKRAEQYSKEHRIPRTYGSYDELLADPSIDAVYVGLPNGLHGQWAQRALEAGKHVLTEKPFGANTQEASAVQGVAQDKGLLCREAFHYREHPLATRIRQLVLGQPQPQQRQQRNKGSSWLLPAWAQPPAVPGGEGGELGRLNKIHVQLLIPKWAFGSGNIRWQEQLAGGAMMDAGCYCVSMLRLLSGAQPKVTSATATMFPNSKVLDGEMRAQLEWPSMPQLRGSLHASLQHPGLLPVTRVEVQGERGSMVCDGFVVPFFGNSVRVVRTKEDTLTLPASQQEKQQQQAEATPTAALSGAGAVPAFSTVAGPLASLQMSSSPLITTLPSLQQLQQPGGMFAGLTATMSQSLESWTERIFGEDQQTTYWHQLSRFTQDVQALQGQEGLGSRSREQVLAAADLDRSDSVANQEVLDSVYKAAGLPVRLPTAQWLALYGPPKQA